VFIFWKGEYSLKEKIFYLFWLAMYIICVGMSTITDRNTVIHILLMVLAIAFYIPGLLLVIEGIRENSKKILLRVRIICTCSLALTIILIIGNIASVYASPSVGNLLNQLFLIVAAPMHCCYYRFISIFLWGCLLMGTVPKFWKSENT
jgi:hypothetical protein